MNFYQAYLNGLSINNDIECPISIYPNPYTNDFSIQNEAHSDISIDIFNSIGVCIFSVNIDSGDREIVIDKLSEINAGIYFVKVNNSINVQRLVKLSE